MVDHVDEKNALSGSYEDARPIREWRAEAAEGNLIRERQLSAHHQRVAVKMSERITEMAAELEQLRQKAALAEAGLNGLLDYGQHARTCNGIKPKSRGHSATGICDCGFDNLLNRLNDALSAPVVEETT